MQDNETLARKKTQQQQSLFVPMGKEVKQRLDYFDIAKGLAMFCVIAGHMGVRHVNAFVFTFHMPLFFIISGYFFKSDAAKVWCNSKRLLTAYLWTVVAIIALSSLFVLADVLFKDGDPLMLVKNAGKWALAGLYGSGARGDCLGLHFPAIGAVWFLLALAWGGAILLVVSKLHGLWEQLVSCFVLFVAGWLSARYTWLPLSIQAGMCATLFMFVGYRVHAYRAFEINKPLIAVCLFTWAVVLYYSFKNGYLEISKNYFPNPVLNIAGGVVGTYLVVCLSRWIEKAGRGILMCYLLFWGRNTLIALCAHLTELNCLPWGRVYALIDCRPVALVVIFCMKVLWATLAIVLVNKYIIGRSATR